jgi:EmrB/QacA subfamily drug resistance transporter
MSQLSQSHKWWVIIATSLALAMIFVDMSALPIALPSMQTDLQASQNQLHWIINAYLLSLAVLIILGGKLGDRIGHRKVFVMGAAVFILSSIGCGLTPTGNWIILARVLQGVGGAFMMPAASPLFRSVVAPEEVGKMAGIYVSIASIFLILGPTLGGFLTQYLSWRWIFWINFPLGIVAISIILRIVPKDQAVRKKENFDWWGFSWLTISLIALVYGLMEGPTLGWSSKIILGCFLVSIITAYTFLRSAKHQTHPFLDLSLFRNQHFAFSIYILLIMQCVFMATVFWAIFFQDMLGLSAAKAGLFMLSAQAPILITSQIAGRMFDRYGPQLPTRLGAVLITFSGLWMTIFCWQASYWWLLPALVLFGFGSPFINLTNISSIVSAVPAEKRGMASGIGSAVRQIGGSVGLAVLGALMGTISLYQLKATLSHTGTISTDMLNMGMSKIFSYTPTYLASHPQADSLYHAAKYAYTLAFSIMMGLVTVLSLSIFFLAKKLPNRSIFAVERSKDKSAEKSPTHQFNEVDI